MSILIESTCGCLRSFRLPAEHFSLRREQDTVKLENSGIKEEDGQRQPSFLNCMLQRRRRGSDDWSCFCCSPAGSGEGYPKSVWPQLTGPCTYTLLQLFLFSSPYPHCLHQELLLNSSWGPLCKRTAVGYVPTRIPASLPLK